MKYTLKYKIAIYQLPKDGNEDNNELVWLDNLNWKEFKSIEKLLIKYHTAHAKARRNSKIKNELR
jgi:hypothetical protein